MIRSSENKSFNMVWAGRKVPDHCYGGLKLYHITKARSDLLFLTVVPKQLHCFFQNIVVDIYIWGNTICHWVHWFVSATWWPQIFRSTIEIYIFSERGSPFAKMLWMLSNYSKEWSSSGLLVRDHLRIYVKFSTKQKHFWTKTAKCVFHSLIRPRQSSSYLKFQVTTSVLFRID